MKRGALFGFVMFDGIVVEATAGGVKLELKRFTQGGGSFTRVLEGEHPVKVGDRIVFLPMTPLPVGEWQPPGELRTGGPAILRWDDLSAGDRADVEATLDMYRRAGETLLAEG